MLCMHGMYEANMAMHDCDLMINIGARFDDRVTGRLDAFSPNSKKIHIDIDASNVNKTIKIDVLPLRDHLSDLHLFVERFGLQFTAKNDIPFKGFSSEALSVLKRYSWPGNVRELKNAVESLLVMNRGERISDEMVIKHLKLDTYHTNSNLPVFVDADTDKVERELILKQLLFLRQDVNEIKQLMMGNRGVSVEEVPPSNPALFLPPAGAHVPPDSDIHSQVEDGTLHAIQDDVIGEITMSELEREMIERALEKFRGNRRKTARALDISERTLYRKINDYGLEKKQKRFKDTDA